MKGCRDAGRMKKLGDQWNWGDGEFEKDRRWEVMRLGGYDKDWGLVGLWIRGLVNQRSQIFCITEINFLSL
jgi:hypothetical protein